MAMRLPVVAVALLLLPLGGGAQSFTIQQALSAPYNSQLSAAPAKGRFAWLAHAEGRRNLWVAEPGSTGYVSRQLTHYDQDDGQDLGEIAWTPDGETVAYTRGGDFEATEKPAPNPALIAQGVEQDVWLVAANGNGAPRTIGVGRSAAISPVGATLVYLHGGEVWSVDWKDEKAKPSLLFKARGSLNSLRWSPDGRSLAFASARGDYGFIGVYSVATKQLSYLDPGTTMDAGPVWSPDSRRVAFLRMPPDPGEGFKPRRTGEPWAIESVDVESGVAREVWRATKGKGSVFRELADDDQIHWTAGGQIVFPWEADGWTHLYAVSADGGTARLLTPGDFEVEDAVLGPDRKRIVFSSNQYSTDSLDADRRHVWSVDPSSGAPVALSSGSGIETYPVIGSDGTVAVLRSDVRVPIRPAVIADGELRDLAPQEVPAEFPAAKFVEPKQVIFNSADGMRIHGQIFLPAGDSDGMGGKHPAIVFFHGGSRRQMLLGWHYMEYYSNAYAMNQYLASLGYVVLSVNYRSGIGYGLDFREALNYGAAGASEFNDVQGAGLYLRGRTDVDAARIGCWGGSYGGYLTALALARASDLFAAGVDLHGVHDWNLELGNWQQNYNPNADPNAARLAWESSPLSSVKTWRSPVLLIQGDDDRNVQFAQTVKLAAALRTQGVYFEQRVFPDEIHDFLLHKNWITAYTLGGDFFKRKLVSSH